MYFDTKFEYEDQIMNEFIEKEMHRYKQEALRKLSAEIVHPKRLESFALCLAYSWFDSQEHAEKIANDLDLNKIDFLAIQEEFLAFSECYLREYEQAANFD